MKQLFQLILLLFIFGNLSAQTIKTSPFKRLPPPSKASYYKLSSSVNRVTAYRFTAPMAGFDVLNNKIVTGAGYGFNRLHWVDSTQKYYTDYSINAVVYAGGFVAPSIIKNNIISVGVSAGFLNQIAMVGIAYNLPLVEGTKGKMGVILNFSVPLN